MPLSALVEPCDHGPPGSRRRLGRPGVRDRGPPRRPARRPRPGAEPKRVGPPTVKTVTLVTGDVVKVSTASDGRQSVTLQPRPDGSIPQAAIQQVHDHVYVVPSEALGLLEANRLDHDLFDVTALIEAEYDDASRGSLPVMVDYGKGAKAADGVAERPPWRAPSAP